MNLNFSVANAISNGKCHSDSEHETLHSLHADDSLSLTVKLILSDIGLLDCYL